MGKFPIYSNLWLDSCQRNYTIDFLLITDQTIQNCPPNVILKNISPTPQQQFFSCYEDQ